MWNYQHCRTHQHTRIILHTDTDFRHTNSMPPSILDVRAPQGVSKIVVMPGGVDGRKGWPSVMFAGANDGSVVIYQVSAKCCGVDVGPSFSLLPSPSPLVAARLGRLGGCGCE